MNLLDLDARWRRLNDPDYVCTCCGRTFSGVFDIGFEEPDDWPYGARVQDMLTVGDDKLSTELCRLGNRRFLRCVIALPLRGSQDDRFYFAPWAEVSQADFYAYLDGSDDAGAPIAALPASVANVLPGYAGPATGTLHPGSGLERPHMRISDGPLAQAQTDGIDLDTLLDIYAASGQDIRPHLTGR